MSDMITAEAAAFAWPVGGYAPGGYMCKCSTCGKTHMAEKRAWQCADCVIQRLHAQLADAKAAQAMVVERVAEIALEFEQCAAPDAIRALADMDGLALVQALRAERDELKQKLISPDPYEDTAHFDDHSVNRFAAVMKGKLASKRLQGRGGWQAPEVPNGYLSRLLREHVDKGDPVDVANLAMMIHQRGERIAPENEGATCKAIDKAEADRARLAAANAALQAQVARLVGLLKKSRPSVANMAYGWPEDDALVKEIDAALADTDGMALVQALRAERDEAKRLMEMRHREMLAADELMRKHQRRAEKAEADRDRLAAANAALEARLARLVEALASLDKAASEVSRLGAVTGSQWTRLNIASLKARAALAEVQADARREGGE